MEWRLSVSSQENYDFFNYDNGKYYYRQDPVWKASFFLIWLDFCLPFFQAICLHLWGIFLIFLLLYFQIYTRRLLDYCCWLQKRQNQVHHHPIPSEFHSILSKIFNLKQYFPKTVICLSKYFIRLIPSTPSPQPENVVT